MNRQLSVADDTTLRTLLITGAFSYTGLYTTRRLLERGWQVRTLTYHPQRAGALGDTVPAFPYRFDSPEALEQALRGVRVLINTYWVRFPHGGATFETAVRNTQALLQAAKQAGVRRVVHVSIANPSLESPLAYYRGKALLEEAVRNSGLSYAILRPTVIFGREDILINNIAWFVRKFPVFCIPGNGGYGLQPIYVEDMARLLADAAESDENYVRDAAGPETFSFEELVRLIGKKLGRRVRTVHVPAAIAYLITRMAGWFVADVILTWEEYKGLMGNLLVSSDPPAGTVRLSEWLSANRESVGVRYASELARHFHPA